MSLMLTVPFPCVYQDSMNNIDGQRCPFIIELAVPAKSGGVCESSLTGAGSCGISIHPKEWNKTHVINIVHQDTGNYYLTTAEAEMKMYLQTFFGTNKLWNHIELPVINVIISLNQLILILNNVFSIILF